MFSRVYFPRGKIFLFSWQKVFCRLCQDLIAQTFFKFQFHQGSSIARFQFHFSFKNYEKLNHITRLFKKSLIKTTVFKSRMSRKTVAVKMQLRLPSNSFFRHSFSRYLHWFPALLNSFSILFFSKVILKMPGNNKLQFNKMKSKIYLKNIQFRKKRPVR